MAAPMSIPSERPGLPDPEPGTPTLCLLHHRMFTACGTPLFRRAETDDAAVMIIELGDRQAALPLRSLQREFGIDDESPDGRMLALIAEALDFVAALRLGDDLPSEVLTGQASWQPDPIHAALANTRLRLQMVAWLTAGTGGDRMDLTAELLLQVADDPLLRIRVQTAIARAAQEMRLSHADQVLVLLEALGEELSYIEALRERLLGRLIAAISKIQRVACAWRGDAHQSETATQVRRLAAIGLGKTQQRFDELDAQTGEVLAALRNAESQRAFIRSHRDWLYRSLRAWEPVLGWWEAAGTEPGPTTAALMGRTYQFLAPRFMPVTEWLSSTRPGRPKPVTPRMVW